MGAIGWEFRGDYRCGGKVSVLNKNKMRFLCGLMLFMCLPKSIYSQASCSCFNHPILSSIIDCDTTSFSSEALLYWQFNCDSSWLTFESTLGHKTILNSMDKDLIEYTAKLGPSFIEEFPDYLLFQSRLISGCCMPSDYLFIDKETGEVIQKIEAYTIAHMDEEILIYFHDENYNKLGIIVLETNERSEIHFEGEKINNTLANGQILFAADLFDIIHLSKGELSISYKYLNELDNKTWLNDTVQFNIYQLEELE